MSNAPDCPDMQRALARAYTAAGHHAEAIEQWTRLLLRRPGDPNLVAGRGRALVEAGQPDEALASARAGLRETPEHPALLALAGAAMARRGQRDTALTWLRRAVELDPSDADAQYDLGEAYLARGDAERGYRHGAEGMRIAPDYRRALHLANTLNGCGAYPAAHDICDQAVRLRPHGAEILNARATALKGMGQYSAGTDTMRQAVAADPRNPLYRMNLATALLAAGRLTADAWTLFDARLALIEMPAWTATATRWNGEDIRGRTILLHAEQGLGDTLQFVRYVPLVASRGARIVLVVQPPLFRLLRSMPGIDGIVAIGDPLPAFDVYCPLMSLPGIFGTDLDTIPPPTPYPPGTYAAPAGLLDGVRELRVGIVWAGNAEFRQDRDRSLAIADLAPLAGIPGIRLVTLQHRSTERLPPGFDAIDRMRGVQDFADTAALIAGLDLVIAVDTAVAHLAATMGTPVWLLSRHLGCWRWLHGRADTPWYPGMVIYRQSRPGSWAEPIQRVRADLAHLAAEPRSRPRPAPSCQEPAGTAPHHRCKVCGAPSLHFGAVRFEGVGDIAYRRCTACSLLFTADMDAWDARRWSAHVYNDGFHTADPTYRENAPAAGAALLLHLFGAAARRLTILDYGGDGRLAAHARTAHGLDVEAHDPRTAPAPQRRFDVVTCFEMLEHATDPRALLDALADRVSTDGLIVFSTMVQPEDIMRQGLDWPYVSPRLGHVTLFSDEALRCAWDRIGFAVRSYGPNLHLAYRLGSRCAALAGMDLPSALLHFAATLPANTPHEFAHLETTK